MIAIFSVITALSSAQNVNARCYLYNAVAGGVGNQLMGTLDLVQTGQQLRINGTITGAMPAGLHGFHIHEKGDIGNGCLNAGGHYNPSGKNHGAPTDTDRHVGDLGNVQADISGAINVDITDTVASLTGPISVMGRGIVLHQNPDDLGKGNSPDSKTTGNAGPRIGCGVIGYA